MRSTYNAYLRAAVDTNGESRKYYKLIGMSTAGNIVIGQSATRNGYAGSEDPLKMGDFSTKRVIMYCDYFTVNRNGTAYTNIDAGNIGTYVAAVNHKHDLSDLTGTVSNGSNRSYLRIDGLAIPSGEWVASYVSNHAEKKISALQEQVNALQAQIGALSSR